MHHICIGIGNTKTQRKLLNNTGWGKRARNYSGERLVCLKLNACTGIIKTKILLNNEQAPNQ
jgi:hypothetical protein